MQKKILVIDDDLLFRSMLVEMLERKEYLVYAAEDGEQGVNIWKEVQPDIVITDIIMPNKEGIETILEMKRQNKSVKIIAISGGGRTNAQDNLRSAKLLGASLTLSKPFDSGDLLTAVQTLLAQDNE